MLLHIFKKCEKGSHAVLFKCFFSGVVDAVHTMGERKCFVFCIMKNTVRLCAFSRRVVGRACVGEELGALVGRWRSCVCVCKRGPGR